MTTKRILIGLIALPFLAAAVSACQESYEQRLARESKEYTRKNCPVVLQEGVTLDSITYEEQTRTRHQWYTLSGQYDTLGIKSNGNMRKQVFSDPNAIKMGREGIAIRYTYRSASHKGKVLMDETITAAELIGEK